MIVCIDCNLNMKVQNNVNNILMVVFQKSTMSIVEKCSFRHMRMGLGTRLYFAISMIISPLLPRNNKTA